MELLRYRFDFLPAPLAEKSRRQELQGFLEKNYRSIRAMRAYRQAIDGGKIRLPRNQEQWLAKYVNQASGGLLNPIRSGKLCEIGDEWQQFQHHGQTFDYDPDHKIDFIKGLFFSFRFNGRYYECVDLDAGLSREHFDEMNKKQRRRFILRFATRWIDREETPIYWCNPFRSYIGTTSFLTDNGSALSIDEIVAFRFPPAE